jgi:DNA recombination protein RmuC
LDYLVDILILIILILCLVGILFLIFRKSESGGSVSIFSENKLDNIQSVMLTEFKNNREEISNQARNGRDELSRSLISALSDFGNKLDKNILSFNELQDKKFNELKDRQTEMLTNTEKQLDKMCETLDKNILSFNELQDKKFNELKDRQSEMLTNTEKQLDKMRETVDEKLTKTLNERLAISFETVSKSLSEVQNGLGEMKALATDVGGLKKVLSHVKTAGIVGEYQLGMLIEQILSPDQYVRNIKFKQRSEHVEFAIKLPGNEDTIYLPIDSKFNQGTYSDLLLAYDSGDKGMIDSAKKIFYSAIVTAAKDIQNKYINPPETTDFAIMFLPFEGIYAEVVRNSDLLSKLQVNYKVVIAGPSTLGAMLSTFRMGFRNLAIQKRSGDAWKVLTDVKSEFETFSVLLEKAKKNIETGLNQIGDVSGRQTNKIIKALKDVETLEAPESIKLIEGAED